MCLRDERTKQISCESWEKLQCSLLKVFCGNLVKNLIFCWKNNFEREFSNFMLCSKLGWECTKVLQIKYGRNIQCHMAKTYFMINENFAGIKHRTPSTEYVIYGGSSSKVGWMDS